MSTPHLWEVDHPYYASTGNYYSRNDACHEEYASWADFARETYLHHGDRDQNFLYRWDWVSPRRPADDSDPEDTADYLALFFILPRKAIACSVHVAVADEDEPAVSAWLEECAATLAAWWQPLNLGRDGGENHA